MAASHPQRTLGGWGANSWNDGEEGKRDPQSRRSAIFWSERENRVPTCRLDRRLHNERMVEHWIEASAALELAGSSQPLLTRLRSGLLECKVKVLVVENERRSETSLPAAFWEVDRYSELVEDWQSGDFSSVIDSERWVALSVRFDFRGVMELLPFERRALATRNLSVAGNPLWMSAQIARRFAYEHCGVSVQGSSEFILEQARLGFLAGRAVLAQCAGAQSSGRWLWEIREWNIPASFWEALHWQSPPNWELGKFKAELGNRFVTVGSVHFTAESVQALAAPDEAAPDVPIAPEPETPKPPLSAAKLNEWWVKKESVKDALSEEELLILARAAHPEHSVSRDRFRELRGPTKRGPKSVSR